MASTTASNSEVSFMDRKQRPSIPGRSPLTPLLLRAQGQEAQDPPRTAQEARRRAPGAKDNKTYTREINGEIRALEGEGNERKFEISFSSELPCNRGWCIEILDHSPGAADLERLNSLGVLLYNHHRDDVLGRIERAWIEDGRGKAIVAFDDDELAERICQKVRGGTLKGVSVGYRVALWEIVSRGEVSSNGKYIGPCDVATSWEPYEISIVSVPADPTVGVGREMEEHSERKQAPFLAQRQLRINLNKLL